MPKVPLVIPDAATAAAKIALAHILASELEQIANECWPDSDVEDYEQSEEDERNGVRSMCNVLRARAAALRSTIQDRLVARAHESGFLRHADAVAAIRAVLADHEPYVDYEEQRPYCRHCYDSDGDSRPWPCATVSAITKALGIAEETT